MKPLRRSGMDHTVLPAITSMPAFTLLYGLEVCSIRKTDLDSLDFVVNRFSIPPPTINVTFIHGRPQRFVSLQWSTLATITSHPGLPIARLLVISPAFIARVPHKPRAHRSRPVSDTGRRYNWRIWRRRRRSGRSIQSDNASDHRRATTNWMVQPNTRLDCVSDGHSTVRHRNCSSWRRHRRTNFLIQSAAVDIQGRR